MMGRTIAKNILIALLLIASETSQAASYYVDSTVPTNGNGLSWADAWNSFDNVNWSMIKPGDNLFLSGGTGSQTYTETLVLPANFSGSPSAPVIITKGKDSGYDGKVVFDGQLATESGIKITTNKYITIRDLHFQNFIGKGAIFIDQSEGIVVENSYFMVCGHGAVFIQRSQSSVIRKNKIDTSVNTTNQTDGIYSQLNRNNIYEGNDIIISNQKIDPHCDGIQMYQDSDITISSNYIEQNNDKQYNAQGIYITNSTGTFNVFNNVVYGPNTENALLTLAHYGEGDAILLGYHNTLIGGGWGTLSIKDSPKSILKNNILVNFKSNGWVFRLSGELPKTANIDYNNYYAPNSKIISTYNDQGITWPEWIGMGFEVHGMNVNPHIEDPLSRKFKLLSDSPLIDVGCEIDPEFALDKDGRSRRQGLGYDLGAYEFIDSFPPAPPRKMGVFPVL